MSCGNLLIWQTGSRAARRYYIAVFANSYSRVAYASQPSLELHALSLPVEIYAKFVRPHRFGFSPNVIEPLTNNFKPLAEGPQKQQILALARANGIDEVAVMTGDASRQSRLLNAHVSGFAGTTRISVDDTTLATTSDAMLRAVTAHEIGHYVLGHTTAFIFTGTLVMGVGLILIAVVTRALLPRFGPNWGISGQADIASLPILWGLVLLLGFASLPVNNAISRVCEHQADWFGLNASQSPHGLAEFMIHDADSARQQPTALEYALFYSHPSAAERVATAMRWRVENARLSPVQ